VPLLDPLDVPLAPLEVAPAEVAALVVPPMDMGATHTPTEQICPATQSLALAQIVELAFTHAPPEPQKSPRSQSMSVRQLAPVDPDEQDDASVTPPKRANPTTDNRLNRRMKP
jgi:hypothetical protein